MKLFFFFTHYPSYRGSIGVTAWEGRRSVGTVQGGVRAAGAVCEVRDEAAHGIRLVFSVPHFVASKHLLLSYSFRYGFSMTGG